MAPLTVSDQKVCMFSYWQDGVHIIKKQEEETTLEQRKLMKTQDLKYIEMKRVAEVKVRAHSLHPLGFPLDLKGIYFLALIEGLTVTPVNAAPWSTTCGVGKE